jgi:hypothetical protein
MNRRDAHLDGMLRHLGVAYYQSLHGRVSGSDVARALDTVEEHVGGQGEQRAAETGWGRRSAPTWAVAPQSARRHDHTRGDR